MKRTKRTRKYKLKNKKKNRNKTRNRKKKGGDKKVIKVIVKPSALYVNDNKHILENKQRVVSSIIVPELGIDIDEKLAQIIKSRENDKTIPYYERKIVTQTNNFNPLTG